MSKATNRARASLSRSLVPAYLAGIRWGLLIFLLASAEGGVLCFPFMALQAATEKALRRWADASRFPVDWIVKPALGRPNRPGWWCAKSVSLKTADLLLTVSAPDNVGA